MYSLFFQAVDDCRDDFFFKCLARLILLALIIHLRALKIFNAARRKVRECSLKRADCCFAFRFVFLPQSQSSVILRMRELNERVQK